MIWWEESGTEATVCKSSFIEHKLHFTMCFKKILEFESLFLYWRWLGFNHSENQNGWFDKDYIFFTSQKMDFFPVMDNNHRIVEWSLAF